MVLNQRVCANVPFHDLSISVLSSGLFPLALICRETHFRTKCRLGLIDAAYLVAFGFRSAQAAHAFASTLTFAQKFPMAQMSAAKRKNEIEHTQPKS